MELAQLEYFLTVVEEGSFTKAADRVYRTQPALSIAIRRLEEEIGQPLLDRAQKTPVLPKQARWSTTMPGGSWRCGTRSEKR